jgi:ABC-type dipeptide/oligopeptide/nickel transport system permease subunit
VVTTTVPARPRPRESFTEWKRRSFLVGTIKAFTKDRFATAAAVVLLLVFVVVLAAPVVAPHDPIRGTPTLRLGTPSSEYWLGLDSQGRDILSRLIWGGRVSIPLALLPVIFATMISSTLALVAGYFGGWIANVVMRLVDIMFAFPTVILAMTIAAFMGAGHMSVLLATTIVLLAPMTRVAYVAVREQAGETSWTPGGPWVPRHPGCCSGTSCRIRSRPCSSMPPRLWDSWSCSWQA